MKQQLPVGNSEKTINNAFSLVLIYVCNGKKKKKKTFFKITIVIRNIEENTQVTNNNYTEAKNKVSYKL